MFNKKYIPYRIKQARLMRGLTKVDLAEKLDVSRQSLIKYESGALEPSDKIISKMAAVLDLRPEFFIKEESRNFFDSPLFFRSGKTSKERDRNVAREKSLLFAEIYELLEQYLEFPELNLPKININQNLEEILSLEEIERYAQTLREHWNLGNEPILNLIAVAQKNGIAITKAEGKGKRIDAFSAIINDRAFVFLGSDKDSNARIRFDLAHELGHLILHANYYDEEDLKDKQIYDKIEMEANLFAGALLLPKETFSKDLYSTSLEHFINLKRKWLSSISSMIVRAQQIRMITLNQTRYLRDRMPKEFWRKEPLDDEIRREEPFMEKQAIMTLLDNDIITSRKLIENIGLNGMEVEKICFLDAGTLNIEIPVKDNIIEFKFV